MEQLAWNAALETGIGEIDSQHKYLLELANRVIAAVYTRQGPKVVGDIVKQLREYTVEHFRDEERCMDGMGYPKLPSHHLEHERLKNQVRQWQRDLYTNHDVAAGEVLAFLRTWLLEHILQSDMDFKKWLAERAERARSK